MPLASPRFRDDVRLQAAAINHPALAFGSKGDPVQTLQRALLELGFAMPKSASPDALLADGIFGQETAQTVKKFQVQQGLTQDGIVGRKTLERLDEIFLVKAQREELALRLQRSRMFWT